MAHTMRRVGWYWAVACTVAGAQAVSDDDGDGDGTHVEGMSLDAAFPDFHAWAGELSEEQGCPVLTPHNADDLLWKEYPAGPVGTIVIVNDSPDALAACVEMRKSQSFIGMANIVQVTSEDVAVELGLPPRPQRADGDESSGEMVAGVMVPYTSDVAERKAGAVWITGGKALARALRASVPVFPKEMPESDMFQQWVMASFVQGKLPIAYFTDKPSAPATIDALFADAELVEDVALKVFVNTSDSQTLQSSMSLNERPVLLLFAPGDFDDKGNMQLTTIEYPRGVKYKYITCLAWLWGAVSEYLPLLKPPTDQEPTESARDLHNGDPTLYALTEDNQDDLFNGKATILVVGLLDTADDHFNEQLSALEVVGSNALLESRSVRYTWVDSACYPEIGEAFGVSQFPQVVAFNNVKEKYALYPSGLESEKLALWVSKLLKGATGMRPLSDRTIRVDDRDCAAIRAKELEKVQAAIEAEGDMGDILAEMAAEKKAKEEQDRIEEEEALAAAAKAKASKGKKKKSKGKKKRKGKGKVVKDEL